MKRHLLYWLLAFPSLSFASSTTDLVVKRVNEILKSDPTYHAATISTTRSMYPVLSEKWILIRDESLIQHARVGMIIVFAADWNSNKLVCHRVIRKDIHGNLYTKGDHNLCEDPTFVTASAFRGKALYAINIETAEVKSF